MHLVWIRLTQILQVALRAERIEVGELPEKRLSRFGFNGSIEPEGLKHPLMDAYRLYGSGSDATTFNCFESKATFILTPVALRHCAREMAHQIKGVCECE